MAGEDPVRARIELGLLAQQQQVRMQRTLRLAHRKLRNIVNENTDEWSAEELADLTHRLQRDVKELHSLRSRLENEPCDFPEIHDANRGTPDAVHDWLLAIIAGGVFAKLTPIGKDAALALLRSADLLDKGMEEDELSERLSSAAGIGPIWLKVGLIELDILQALSRKNGRLYLVAREAGG